jgi:glycosyltransferase involved in cell wall biosynthesis
MRIGFFTQNVRKGGLDTFLINLLKHWQKDDEIVLFCNRSHPGLLDLRRELCPRVEIVAYDFLVAHDLHERVAQYGKPVRILLKDVFWVLGFPYLVQSVRRLMRRHPCDRMMIVNGGYPGGDACLAATVAWASMGNGKPLAWHNFHNLTLPYSANPWRRFKERWIDFLVARSAAGFVTVSAACLDTLSKRPVLMGANGRFIHNGMMSPEPMAGSSLRAELGLAESAELVLMLAVYEQRKGHAFIFEAMRELIAHNPRAYLLVCGDGSPADIERVRALREASFCRDRIILQTHREDVARLLSQVDVLAVPSQSQESFGYMALEAMYCGLAVVCTDVGGLPEVVEDGRTGFVVSRNDAIGFGRVLADLLSDPARRYALGEAGKVRARELFSVERMTNQYMAIVE